MHISGINEIIEKYDFFILDIWGVIHDGVNIYPGTKRVLTKFREMGKPFCFLSNSPRPANVAYAKFLQLGLDFISPDQIVTSGDFFRYEVQSGNFKQLQMSKIFSLDAEKNKDILLDLNLNIVPNLSDADYFIIMSYTGDLKQDEPRYKEFFEQALKLDKVALCPNPDRIVNDGVTIKYVNGYFAHMYQKMGGKVHYFGKPYIGIYQYLAQKFSPSLAKTIAIGDSVETDIVGASRFKIDSLLVKSGIHSKEQNIEKIFDLYQVKANYISDSLDL